MPVKPFDFCEFEVVDNEPQIEPQSAKLMNNLLVQHADLPKKKQKKHVRYYVATHMVLVSLKLLTTNLKSNLKLPS